ncbi:MAG: Gfo/Idh/MocA family oxidoreductase [Acidimicrobiia bacterium]
MTDQIAVGVIGLGGMGGRHVDNLQHSASAARVVAVMDVDQGRLADTAARCAAKEHEDAYELIADPSVEAVLIASPDASHAELTLACISAGKPVLCEKPLATAVADARSVVDAEVAARRRLVQVGLMRHYDPQHVDVRDSIARGDIGRALFFRGWHRNVALTPLPSTREAMVNSVVHDLYSARWLLDSEIAEISVLATPIDQGRSVEPVLLIISLRMTGGALAVIEFNMDSSYGYEVGIEVVGSEGTVTGAPHHTPRIRRGGQITQPVEQDWLERFARAYELEVTAWARSALEGRVDGPSAWDGYATLAAAEAGVRAISEGPQVLDLGDPPA